MSAASESTLLQLSQMKLDRCCAADVRHRQRAHRSEVCDRASPLVHSRGDAALLDLAQGSGDRSAAVQQAAPAVARDDSELSQAPAFAAKTPFQLMRKPTSGHPIGLGKTEVRSDDDRGPPRTRARLAKQRDDEIEKVFGVVWLVGFGQVDAHHVATAIVFKAHDEEAVLGCETGENGQSGEKVSGGRAAKHFGRWCVALVGARALSRGA